MGGVDHVWVGGSWWGEVGHVGVGWCGTWWGGVGHAGAGWGEPYRDGVG